MAGAYINSRPRETKESKEARKRNAVRRKSRVGARSSWVGRAKNIYQKAKKLVTRVQDAFERETLLQHFSEPLKGRAKATLEKLAAGQKIVDKFVNESEDFMSRYTRTYEGQEERLPGFDQGEIFKMRIDLCKGMKADKQMRMARTLYEEQSISLFDSESVAYAQNASGNQLPFPLAYSSAGYNRQGMWSIMDSSNNVNYVPSIKSTTATGPVKNDLYNFVSPMFQTMLVPQLMVFFTIWTKYMSDETQNWCAQSDQGSGDVKYIINNLIDVVTFSNFNQFLPVDFRVYICKAKIPTNMTPSSCLDGDGKPDRALFLPFEYMYTPAYKTFTDPENNQVQAHEFCVEKSMHVAATPQMSPMFRSTWDVLDVVKFRLKPSDKMELTIDRCFRHSTSLREMYTFYEVAKGDTSTATKMEGYPYYNTGDLAMLITFKGVPCFLEWFTPDQGGGETGSYKAKDVSVSPTKVTVRNRSSMRMSFPDAKSITPPEVPAEDEFVTGTVRVLDTQIETAPYTSEWKPIVMSSEEVRVGGGKDGAYVHDEL